MSHKTIYFKEEVSQRIKEKRIEDPTFNLSQIINELLEAYLNVKGENKQETLELQAIMEKQREVKKEMDNLNVQLSKFRKELLLLESHQNRLETEKKLEEDLQIKPDEIKILQEALEASHPNIKAIQTRYINETGRDIEVDILNQKIKLFRKEVRDNGTK